MLLKCIDRFITVEELMEEQILILCLLRRHKGKINRKSKTY